MKPIRPIHGKDQNNYERVHDRTHDILNGNVDLGSISGVGTGAIGVQGNLSLAQVGATSPGAANTDFPVTHNLGRIPTGFLVTNRSAPCHVYGGGTSWTTSQIFVKCDTINVLLNFIIF